MTGFEILWTLFPPAAQDPPGGIGLPEPEAPPALPETGHACPGSPARTPRDGLRGDPREFLPGGGNSRPGIRRRPTDAHGQRVEGLLA